MASLYHIRHTFLHVLPTAYLATPGMNDLSTDRGKKKESASNLQTPTHLIHLSNLHYESGGRWIRTTESIASRFTVCPLWPLGNSPIRKIYEIENFYGKL